MTEPAITKELIAKHGLTDEEYARIQGILGRDPNITELGVFSVMWSEHCSYKNTRLELRKFPTTGPLVLVNVAASPSSQFWASRSAVESFLSAAAGVGGKVAKRFPPVCRGL